MLKSLLKSFFDLAALIKIDVTDFILFGLGYFRKRQNEKKIIIIKYPGCNFIARCSFKPGLQDYADMVMDEKVLK